MKMKLSVYNGIIDLINTYRSRECVTHIAEKFPGISVKTIGSIYSQEYQKKMRKTHFRHYQLDVQEHYYQLYLEKIKEKHDHVLLQISEMIDLSPALLARTILERHLAHTMYSGDNAPRSSVTAMIKEPNLIEDPVLAKEIHECIVCDDHYGPIVDSIKHAIGHEYECKLNRILDELKLTYIGEDQMRAQGYDKTPDVKLEVPIAVDGHVVNWIESKASFGDEFSHRGYLKDQFWAYWNRFGPGMVIYWFGFIEELDVNRDKGIILMDSFPDNIVTMNPLL